MPITIVKEPVMTQDLYTVKEHIYVTAQGVVVPEAHPDVHMLLFSKGQRIPMETAVACGVYEVAEEPVADGKSVAAPPATKAVKPSKNK